MVRFFVYHTEALDETEPKRTILHVEYMKNEKLLYNIITTPAMILTTITGIIMILQYQKISEGQWFSISTFMHIKLAFVVGLLAYHFYCGTIMKKLRTGEKMWSSFQFRLWNEVATLFLVAIVFIVVLKHTINWLWGTIGFISFAVLIMIVVRLVKKTKNTKVKEDTT